MRTEMNAAMGAVIARYPFARDWLDGFQFVCDIDKTFEENLLTQRSRFYEEAGLTPDEFQKVFYEYLYDMETFLNEGGESVQSVTLLPGRDKDGETERFERIEIKTGDIVAVVGATGSGKSRLLADIEWGADRDTPTMRRVLINGRVKRREQMGRTKKRLVAQLSQNMNFVIDLGVREFLDMHARCYMADNPDKTIERVFGMANDLCGEPFSMETPITGLSGGQSRALMIADCALLSSAPVVLIDEIENAGINRRKALELLTGEDKIVIIATHDPALALLAHFRLIVKNGGIVDVIVKNPQEQEVLAEVERLDRTILEYRQQMRDGLRLSHCHIP